METYLEKLILSDPLRDPVIRQAIRELWLLKGSRGLDAGCGTGHHTLLLAGIEELARVGRSDRSADFDHRLQPGSEARAAEELHRLNRARRSTVRKTEENQ